MPAATTFSSLQDDVRAYLERGSSADVTVFAQLPRLINLAEHNIAQEMKIQGFVNVVTTDMAIGQSVYPKPDRWRETVTIMYGNGTSRVPMFPREYGYCRMYWPDASQVAAPKFYADYDYRNWLFVATPDAAYHFEVTYYEMPALLDDTNTTNWLTDFAPQVLLYRTLWEAGILMKDDQVISRFQPMYAQALGGLNTEDVQKIVDRTSTRQKP